MKKEMPTVSDLIKKIKKIDTPEATELTKRLEKNILKDEDVKLIEELAKSEDWLIRTVNIARKDEYKTKIEITIDDLNNEQLKELLPKIDLYIERFSKISIDEFWIIKYLNLIKKIEQKLSF